MTILTLPPRSSRLNTQKISKTTFKNDAHSGGIVTSAVREIGADGRLVVRGNPRISISVADAVEFPSSESASKSYMVRARAKRRYSKREQLDYRHEKRSTLYAGMVTAGKVLPNYVNKKGETRQHSVCLCRRFMQTHENAKSHVILSVDGNHIAKFTDLIVCDNNWLCPVCSSLHLDRKSKQITQVQKNFLAAGRDKKWSTWMLTLTIPHTRSDKLGELLAKKSAVMSDFHAHSAIKKLKARIGWQGYVDSLEIRHGSANGWHPHHHILGFFTNMHPNTRVQCVYDKKRDYYRIATQADKRRGKGLHKIEVQQYIYQIFAYLCVKHGLKRPNIKHGVDFRQSDDIQDYLTKQSKIAHELTAEHDKKSNSSKSQWEILRDCESDDPQLAAYSESLFIEFADATKGRAKLHWSPEFMALWLDEEDEENEEKLQDDSAADDSQDYIITGDIWNRFFSAADRKNQCKLLKIAEKDSFENTENTKLILLVARIILDIEKEKEEQSYSDEQERLFQEWLMMPPAPPPDFIDDFSSDYQYS